MEQEEANRIDAAKSEYSEVCINIRHYSNMRFVSFSVFIGLISGIAFGIFGIESSRSAPEWFQIIAKIAGTLITILAWVNEHKFNYIISFPYDQKSIIMV